jgi:DNA-directed RNA polymerase specialized sigma24 family protein
VHICVNMACAERVDPIPPDTHENDRAFLAFMQPYARIIKHTIWRVCGERYPALHADIEQEVYLTLWAQWTDQRCIDSPISYMYKVALRAALAMLRSYSAVAFVDHVVSRLSQ